MIGKDVGRSNDVASIIFKETSPSSNQYLDIAGLKINEDNHFCIVTLKNPVQFGDNVAPLCLPDINNIHNQYDDEEDMLRAQILGFGYDKEYGNQLKEQARTERKTNERLITKQPYRFENSTLCMQRYRKWALSRHTTKHTHESLSMTSPQINDVDIWNFGYFWIEK